MMTINALAASDSVIIPVQAHYLPAKGMTQLLQTVARVRRQINPKLAVDGVPWNGRSISMAWAVHEGGVDQIGCVHTSQGLEFDYVGVIIGNDLTYDPITMRLKADYNSYKDSVGKKGLKNEPEKLAELVKNVYRILISRGI